MEHTAKILIADENPNQRQALRDGLARAGYRFIEEAANGEEALLKIGGSWNDCLLISYKGWLCD